MQHPATTHRTSTRRLWTRAMLVFVAVCLWIVAGFSVAVAGPVDDAEVRVVAAADAVSDARAERSTQERDYAAITRKIETLKSDTGLADDFELQRLLREARAQADELNQLAARIRDLEKRERAARSDLVAAYDQAIRDTERKLVAADTAQQGTLVAELQNLQSERESARLALDATRDPLQPIDVPDLGGFESADPEEILAAADELADNEERLQGQLTELESRIDALEQRRRISAYAEDVSDEANLFGEEARSTRVRGTAPARTADKSSGDAANGSGQPAAPATGGGVTVTSGGEAEPSAPSTPTTGAMDPTATPNETPPETDFDQGFSANDDSIRDGGGDLGLEPTLGDSSSDLGGGPAVAPPSTGRGQTDIIRSDADPNVVAGGRSVGGGFDAELADLKSRKGKLRKSIEDVKAQKKRLRKRAKELGVEP